MFTECCTKPEVIASDKYEYQSYSDAFALSQTEVTVLADTKRRLFRRDTPTRDDAEAAVAASKTDRHSSKSSRRASKLKYASCKNVTFDAALELTYNNSIATLPANETKTQPFPTCSLYNQHIDMNYSLCTNCFNAQPMAGDLVTLVTQLTWNRFKSVKRMALKWLGPMSVAFYMTQSEFEQNKAILDQWSKRSAPGQRDIVVNIMIKRGVRKS